MRIACAAVVLLLSGAAPYFLQPVPSEASCCAVTPLAAAATCTGSPDCKACKSCKNCGYCKAGGTCGVCAPNADAPSSDPASDPARAAPADPEPATAGDAPRYPAFKKSAKSARVVRVIDGDTIVVEFNGENETVRLKGIDTPESVHPDRPVEAFGQDASAFTNNLLAGESVWLAPDQGRELERDSLGRLLAHVYRVPDGLWVNLEIVRLGYGRVFDDHPPRQVELFQAYEGRARKAGKGLWGKKE